MKEWKCKYSMFKNGKWVCALKLFYRGDNWETHFDVPVVGCWGWECIHNPVSKQYDSYDKCCSSTFTENGGKCPHCNGDCSSGSWCEFGETTKSVTVMSDIRCFEGYLHSKFALIGGCPKYAELSPEEVKQKLKRHIEFTSACEASGFFGKLDRPRKWILDAEKYAGCTILTDWLKLDAVKKWVATVRGLRKKYKSIESRERRRAKDLYKDEED